jgi:hypothetical protein
LRRPSGPCFLGRGGGGRGGVAGVGGSARAAAGVVARGLPRRRPWLYREVRVVIRVVVILKKEALSMTPRPESP